VPEGAFPGVGRIVPRCRRKCPRKPPTAPLEIGVANNKLINNVRSNGKKGDIVKARFVKSEYAPAVEAVLARNRLQAVWHEFRGDRCADIEKSPVNGTYEVAEISIPEGVKAIAY